MSQIAGRRRKRKTYRKKRIGRGLLTSVIGALTGLGRRRVHRRRVHRRKVGRGLLDSLKSIGNAILPVIGSVAKDVGASFIKSKLGLGKRRKRVHRRRIGGARRTVRSKMFM